MTLVIDRRAYDPFAPHSAVAVLEPEGAPPAGDIDEVLAAQQAHADTVAGIASMLEEGLAAHEIRQLASQLEAGLNGSTE